MSIDMNNEMRDFMQIIGAYTSIATNPAEIILEEVSGETQNMQEHPVLSELRDLIFKLRSHTENEDSDRSLGLEEGMQLAADMIENLVKRYEGDNDLG